MNINLTRSIQIYTIEDWKKDAENVIQLLQTKLDQTKREIEFAKKKNNAKTEQFENYIRIIDQQKEEIERNEEIIAQLKKELDELNQ